MGKLFIFNSYFLYFGMSGLHSQTIVLFPWQAIDWCYLKCKW